MTSLLLGLLALLQVAAPQQPTITPPQPAYVPERVYDARQRAFSDFEAMLADVAKADVIFIGEQHDDPNTHRLEVAVLEGLRRRGAAPTLSLEMFERDVQPALDSYLAGKTTEDEFLKTSRPWPRYATDYRALVEMAKAQTWPVIASNVPRRYASEVAKSGLKSLDAVPSPERSWVAADLQCPKDAYFDRFADTMNSHQPGGDKRAPNAAGTELERYYLAQCLKDETMAEAIAGAYERLGRRPIVHVTGAFHSDFGTGTAERVRRRLNGRRVAIVTMLPVKDMDALAPAGEDLQRADYLVYTSTSK
jgi:uncharacterized iron-regulated protein